MKKIISLFVLCAMVIGMLCGCHGGGFGDETLGNNGTTEATGENDQQAGESLDDMNAYDGYFEEEKADITVKCISGTEDCYTLEDNVLTFTEVSEDSVYSVSGELKGNIVIDIGDDHEFELELHGLSLVCDSTNPVTILSGDQVSVTAKNGFENYIYDTREAVDSTQEGVYSAAIHSKVDLVIGGKGSLTVISENNNGIHTKDDLKVKNLDLLVSCVDNALKGNDSVKISGGSMTLIATQGDGIKTSNSDISSKGKQRGSVTISGGEINIYAACDGIDAAYDVNIEDESAVLNIYTDKYSAYSEEVTATDENLYFIRYTGNSYHYSVKYYNSEEDFLWVNATYHSKVSAGRTTYYYYAVEKVSGYEKMDVYIYNKAEDMGQEDTKLLNSGLLTINTQYDTFALTSNRGNLYYEWTNYTTQISGGMGGFGGMGGMNEGNSEKGDHSTKGMKAGNAVNIENGTIYIKSYDDCIHADQGTELENGETSLGNVTISGGTITAYSNDDAVHADNTVTVSGGKICVTHSYEGLEGQRVNISGGHVSITASDDGINGTATSGVGIEISGGRVYICCSGDGLDSNSRSSYEGIVFSGGEVVVISDSTMNSAIDTEAGYTYSGGSVVAVMPARGMSNEATHCDNFNNVATKTKLNLSADDYLTVTLGGDTIVTVKMPLSLSAMVIYLGNNGAKIVSESSSAADIDSNGVCWSENM